jgi:hypothetical protein
MKTLFSNKNLYKIYVAAFASTYLAACSTAIAVVDTAGSAIVYTGKTIVNTVDKITPDIVNNKK